MKRYCDSLGKHIRDVIVGVRPVVKIGSKCSLPFLRLNDTVRVRCVKKEALELHLSDSSDRRSRFESEISIGFIGIRPFDESNFRIEVGPDFSTFEYPLYPVRAIGQGSPKIAVPTEVPRRLRLGHMCIHTPVLEEDQARIDSARLIEAILHIAGALIDAHHADIRTTPQGLLEPDDRVICIGIRATRAGVHIHDPELQAAYSAAQSG